MDWRWPFTVSTTPGGLPSCICTACFSVHVLEEPAGTTPMKICDPSVLFVSRTQQSSTALSWITTSCEVGVGDGCAVGFALAVGWCDGAATGLGGVFLLWCDTSRYVPNPMMASSTTTTIMLRLSERRSRILTGVDRLEHVGRPDRPGRAVLGVVRADQRDRVGADDAGDAADVPAGVEVTAAGGEVVLLDVPDDRFPDPGLLADLADGETGLTAGFRQGFADAHAPPPRADRRVTELDYPRVRRPLPM